MTFRVLMPTGRSRLIHRVSVALVMLNAFGAFGYVSRASLAWRIPQEQGLDSITGEPIIWAMSVLPIVAVFLPVNLTWGSVILSYRQWQSGRLWFLAVLIWLAAIAIDFAHH